MRVTALLLILWPLAACGAVDGTAAEPVVDPGVAVVSPAPVASTSAAEAEYALPARRGEALDPDMELQIRCVRAPCGNLPAVSAANRVSVLYHRHPEFYLDPEPAAELLTPTFRALIQADVACASEHGMCAIGADPWSAAQDGQRGGLLTVVTRDVQGHHNGTPVAARVEVCFDFRLGDAPEGRRCAVAVVKRAADEPWRVDDLIDPDGQSLRALLEAGGSASNTH